MFPTVFLLVPKTDDARRWVREHLPDDVMRLGAGVAIEHRYIEDILEGIQADGLTAKDFDVQS
jgi:hypothetical protein